VITGNPGGRPIKEDLDLPEADPSPPSYLKNDALEEWERVAPGLHAAGILTAVDIASLAAYCIAYGRWRSAEDAIAKMAERDALTSGLMIKTTNGNAIQNPLVGTSNKAASDMVRFAAEFGMTPSARSRISIDGQSKKASNKFSQLKA
jgi:P27 family predicted phage terminase small subunit